MTWVHLHRHSEYSVVDGTGTADEWAERAVELGQPALALTDHGTLGGALEHIQACEKRGIFPIVGVEAYFKPDRSPQTAENRAYYHMVVLAKNFRGWRSLLRLTSESYADDAFYYKPIVDMAMLDKHRDGLMVSTACMAGYVAKNIAAGDPEEAELHLDWLLDTFGDDLYMEIMPNTIPEQRQLNEEIVNLGMRKSIPIVATTDAHYTCVEWSSTHQILVEHVYEHEDNTLFLMKEKDAAQLFQINHPGLPKSVVDESFRNSEYIVSRCEPYYVSRAPKYPRVEGGAEAAENILREWCIEGLDRILPHIKDIDIYNERMEYELGVFKKNDVLDYFVIVGDLVRWAKDNDVVVGCGRGSAAGSLVSFLIGITGLDPIAHKLLFERFLNPDRKGQPDIDIDFADDSREKAKEYFRERWGRDKVAEIITYQTFGARSALQTVGRALGINPAYITSVTKTWGDSQEDLDTYLKTSEPFQQLVKENPALWTHARRIESQTKAVSKHAAGVVVTDRPISEYMPTMRSKEGGITTAWSDKLEFPIISKYGFLKIDFLGLVALTKQKLICDLIRKDTGEDIKLDELPIFMDPDAGDPEVLAGFGANMSGIFQFESAGMVRLLRDMKPDHFNDLVVAVALFRPGPMANIPSYVARKHGEEPVSYLHDSLEPILNDTYGLYVFQEQAMQISQVAAGFTGGEADTLRSAIGKKDVKLMTSLRDAYLRGCKKRGYSDDIANALWAENEASADYSFNRSHSACYAAIAYCDKFLKTKYEPYFYSGHLSTEDDKKKMAKVIREATSAGLKFLPPDVNLSERGFSVNDGQIRFGLTGIHGIADAAIGEILGNRPYFSVDHFKSAVKKTKCNAGKVDILKRAGAFDEFGERDDWAQEDIVRVEKELLGFTLSSDWDALHQTVSDRAATITEFDVMQIDEELMVGGEITSTKVINTKKGQLMAFGEITFGSDVFSITAFPKKYTAFASLIQEGEWVMVIGNKDDRGSIIVEEMCLVQDLIDQEAEAASAS